ncbi:efflux RND transporter periplasmic adaptor subunit [Methylosinus sp.]|uniref:efflux RND transporter periplasmic adaptor subunit n=1 Tax=Methylosinus sp. TaxID=427 RepID=UPI002F927597
MCRMSKMRGRRRWLALGLMACVMGAGSLVGSPDRFFSSSKPAGAPAEAAPTVVTVSAPVAREVVDWIAQTGRLRAIDRVELIARVGGYLTEIRAKDGQMVRKGDLLFTIDPRPFQIQLRKASAQRKIASSQLDLARKKIARSSALRRTHYISEEEHDLRLQQLKDAEGAVEQAEAAVEAAELDLEFSRVTAPFDGRIGARRVSIGDFVNSGGAEATPLATIVSLDPIYLEFDLSEADYVAYLRSVESGLDPLAEIEVRARLIDESEWSRSGHLVFVDNSLDRNTGTIRMRATLDNHDHSLTPGQFARVRLPASRPHSVMLVSDSSLSADQAGKTVLVVEEGGKVVGKKVETGPLVDGLRVIRRGLDASDRVIVEGPSRSRPGNRVSVRDGRIEATAH